jgi:hypothetical protein
LGGIFFFLAWRVCDTENGRVKRREDCEFAGDGRGRRCRQICSHHRSMIISHELYKKRKKSANYPFLEFSRP